MKDDSERLGQSGHEQSSESPGPGDSTNVLKPASSSSTSQRGDGRVVGAPQPLQHGGGGEILSEPAPDAMNAQDAVEEPEPIPLRGSENIATIPERTELLNGTVEDLLALLRRDDGEARVQALNGLFAVYSRDVFRCAYRILGQFASKQEADELTSETFVRAWTHFSSFEGTTRPVFTRWLLKIASNLSLRRRKKLARESEHIDWNMSALLSGEPTRIANDQSPGYPHRTPQELIGDDCADIVMKLQDEDAIRKAVRREFRKLSLRQRQCLGGVYRGYTQAQIAKKLGISMGTVAYHIAEGYRRLRVALGDFYFM